MNWNKINSDKSHIRILLAEDNDLYYLLLKILLKGYNLVRVDNGEKAVKKVKQDFFDLVLMDTRMPKLNGFEATQTIRKFNKEIPIIALTADVFMRQEALDAGCNELLTKPIQIKELTKIISSQLCELNEQ